MEVEITKLNQSSDFEPMKDSGGQELWPCGVEVPNTLPNQETKAAAMGPSSCSVTEGAEGSNHCQETD